MSMEDAKHVKQGHEAVLRMEQHCKKIAGIIKVGKKNTAEITKNGGVLMTQDEINLEISENNEKEQKILVQMQKLDKMGDKNYKNEDKMLAK